jgi:AcrR family transcriptional regulator|tara:strand:+ start:763 stop:1395 length:633 start_codon:yes stop_codon:yes gene_type:complete
MVEVAGHLFAERGFGAVSTREIAKAASVNLSAISYHFDNKEGLYRAVFEKIIRDLKPLRRDLALLLEHRLASADSNHMAYADIIREFISRLIGETLPSEGRWRIRLILREIDKPGECFPVIMEGHINVVHDLLVILLARYRGEASTQETIRLEASAILMFCLQQGAGLAVIKARLGWQEIGPEEAQKVKDAAIRLVLGSLGLPRPAPFPK